MDHPQHMNRKPQGKTTQNQFRHYLIDFWPQGKFTISSHESFERSCASSEASQAHIHLL